MTSATQRPALQTSGAQHWVLSAQGPHVARLQAWPLQSLQWSTSSARRRRGSTTGQDRLVEVNRQIGAGESAGRRSDPKSVVGAVPPSMRVAAGA